MCIWQSITLLVFNSLSVSSIFSVVAVESEKEVGLILTLSEAPIHYFFIGVFKVSTRDVMDCLQLCFGIGIEHVRHPFALYGLQRMIDSRAAYTEGFPAELISKFVENIKNLCLFQTTERHVFEIAVEVCTCDERMMISFDDEVKIDMWVGGDEMFKLLRNESVSDS